MHQAYRSNGQLPGWFFRFQFTEVCLLLIRSDTCRMGYSMQPFALFRIWKHETTDYRYAGLPARKISFG